jgi:putative transposase
MGRKTRDVEPGGIYHVRTRGNNREPLYFDDHDRAARLEALEGVARKYGWDVLAFCLMTNHDHWIVRVPLGGLSAGMQVLNTGYSRRTNRRYGRTGHLFRNRFESSLLETQAHLLLACRYVVLNPVRARMQKSPELWPWSSYRACAGLDLAPVFLADSELLKLFSSRPAAARKAYRAFVHDGLVLVSDTAGGSGGGASLGLA